MIEPKYRFVNKQTIIIIILIILIIGVLIYGFYEYFNSYEPKIQIYAVNQSNFIADKIIIYCDELLNMYMNQSEELADYTGISIYAVDKCYDLYHSTNLDILYEENKWSKLNSCWVLENRNIGRC